MPAKLQALSEGPSILLDKPILLIGRGPECDIQLNSRKISRLHCCIAEVSNYLVVRDLGSTNGIRVNGVRLEEGRLVDGDELTIGSHRYSVQWEGVAPKRPPSKPMPALGKPEKPEKERAAPAAPVKGAARDDQFDSCDDPVALAEPPKPAKPAAREKPVSTDRVPVSYAPIPMVDEFDSEKLADDDDASMPLIPDEIKLLPNSDIFPGPKSK